MKKKFINEQCNSSRIIMENFQKKKYIKRGETIYGTIKTYHWKGLRFLLKNINY